MKFEILNFEKEKKNARALWGNTSGCLSWNQVYSKSLIPYLHPRLFCVWLHCSFFYILQLQVKRGLSWKKEKLIQAKINTQVGGENKRKHLLLFVVFQVPSFGSHGLHSLLLVLQPIWLQPENSRRYIESVSLQKWPLDVWLQDH